MSNPVLSRAANDAAATANAGRFTNNAAGLTSAPATMTVADVVVKTGISFVVLLVGAAVGWNLAGPALMLSWVAGIAALIVAVVALRKKKPSAVLTLLYAALEGVVLGAVSAWYAAYGASQGNGNLVGQAVGATLVVFAVVLFAYLSGLVKVTSRSRKVFTVMLLSYLGVALLSLVASLFGVGGGWGFYGVSGIGLIISLVAVALASYSLVIDFDTVARSASYGVPEAESWRLSLGVLVSLVWLYLEIIRLLGIANR